MSKGHEGAQRPGSHTSASASPRLLLSCPSLAKAYLGSWPVSAVHCVPSKPQSINSALVTDGLKKTGTSWCCLFLRSLDEPQELSPEFLVPDTPQPIDNCLLCPGHNPGLSAPSRPYLEGICSVVDITDRHVAPVLCALAVGLAQLEGLRL